MLAAAGRDSSPDAIDSLALAVSEADNPNLIAGILAGTITEPPPEWTPTEPDASFAKDLAVSAVSGVQGTGAALVGLADLLLPGDQAEQARRLGLDYPARQRATREHYSSAQKRQAEALGTTEGVIPTLRELAKHPSQVAHLAVESLPLMAGGGAIAKGIRTAWPGIAALVAGGVGEGAIGAGLTASGFEDETGDLTPLQRVLAVSAGGATGLVGVGGGRLAQRLGLPDPETLLAGGRPGARAAFAPAAALTEAGEEILQAPGETIAENVGMGRPALEGLPQAATLGGVTGGVVGGGVGIGQMAMHGLTPAPPAPAVSEIPPIVSETPPSIQETPPIVSETPPIVSTPATPAPAPAPEPKPEPAAEPVTFDNPADGTQTQVSPHAQGWSVSLTDPAAGETRDTVRIFPPDQREEALAHAKSLVEPAPEDEAETHDYSNTQVPIEGPAADTVRELSNAVKDEDLSGEGRQDPEDLHVTVKYGLHTTDPEAVRAIVEATPPVRVRLGETNTFPDRGDGEVLKLDVESDDLAALRDTIAKALPATDDFADAKYHPHITLAYVKPGTGAQYTGENPLTGQEIEIEALTFSGKDGVRTTIPLRGERPTAAPRTTPVAPQHDTGTPRTAPVAPQHDTGTPRTTPIRPQYDPATLQTSASPAGSTPLGIAPKPATEPAPETKPTGEAATHALTPPPVRPASMPRVLPTSVERYLSEGQPPSDAKPKVRQWLKAHGLIDEPTGKYKKGGLTQDGQAIRNYVTERNARRRAGVPIGEHTPKKSATITPIGRQASITGEWKGQPWGGTGGTVFRGAKVPNAEDATAVKDFPGFIKRFTAGGRTPVTPIATTQPDAASSRVVHFDQPSVSIPAAAYDYAVTHFDDPTFSATTINDHPLVVVESGGEPVGVVAQMNMGGDFDESGVDALRTQTAAAPPPTPTEPPSEGLKVTWKKAKIIPTRTGVVAVPITEGVESKPEGSDGTTPTRADGPDVRRGEPGPEGAAAARPLDQPQPADGDTAPGGRGQRPAGDARPQAPDQDGSADAGVSGGEPAPRPSRGQRNVHDGTVDAASGDTAKDPGARPAGYTLTADRIAQIAARGAVQRADDNVAVIELLKRLDTEHRYATPTEQDLLASYVGWGDSAVNQFLATKPRPKWSARQRHIHERLHAATTDAERKALQASRVNAHFTFGLYVPIWEALTRHGFTGGRVLEPAVGTGHAWGLMPPQTRESSRLAGVELEPITAQIAAALYPAAKVQATGYQDSRITRHSQDLVISNVPFGNFPVFDKALPVSKDWSIHNYYFAKALEHVRPGGLIAFVTTHQTMDAATSAKFREYVTDRAEVLGAVRLPVTAFAKTAKTEVITDIILLRALKRGETASNPDRFIQSGKLTVDGPQGERTFNRSTYFDAHPDMVLGTERASGTMRGIGGNYNVEGTATLADIQDRLERILPADGYTRAQGPAAADPVVEDEVAPENIRPFEFHDVGGVLHQADEFGTLQAFTPTKQIKGEQRPDGAKIQRIQAHLPVRTALREVMTTMLDTAATDTAIAATQATLRTAYNTFHKKYKELNNPSNSRAFAIDPQSTNLLALEVVKTKAVYTVNKNGRRTLKRQQLVTGLSDIFTKRTIQAAPEVTHVDTPQEALWASLSSSASIDWSWMAQVAGTSRDSLQDALLDSGDVFMQPNGAWVTREEYLSGDVVTKLEQASTAAKTESGFTGNVTALEAAQPARLTAAQIKPSLGAHWIPEQYIADFIDHELGGHYGVSARYHSMGVTRYWEIGDRWQGETASLRHPLAVPYGPKTMAGGKTKTYTFFDMLDATLNLRQPTLTWTEGSGDNKVTKSDPVATIAARENIVQLQQRWLDWLAADGTRITPLVDIYNTRFNRTRLREWNGDPIKDALKRHGLALNFDLHPWQLRAIWRALIGGNTLLAHDVGAGKTFEMIAAAMAWRKTGRARKPMITVPNATLPGWRQSILTAYPTAKVLMFDESDLSSKKRQTAMARIAYGDWDIVLVPHSSFKLLAVKREAMVTQLNEWLNQARAAVEDPQTGEIDKEGEKQLKRLESRILKLMADTQKGEDANLTWEDLGVDGLIVDEAQEFKNLFMFTSLDKIQGLSKSSSARALDLFIKIQSINQASGERNMIFATATPVMNSVAELYTFQRYLQPSALTTMGTEAFDSWYSMFLQAGPSRVQKPDGSYKEVTRIKGYNNLVTLHQTVMQVTDYVGPDDMPHLKRPALKGGSVTVLENPPHPKYTELLVPWFKQRMQTLREDPPWYDPREKVYHAPQRVHPITGADMPNKDNQLTVINDARLATVDVRLITGLRQLEDYDGSRVKQTADLVTDFYAKTTTATDTTPEKGAAIVFLDVGTPAGPTPMEFLAGVDVQDAPPAAAAPSVREDEDEDENPEGEFIEQTKLNMYDELRRALVQRGIPNREIAYVHQAKNDTEAAALYDAVNAGTVRVLLASTARGGVGVNVQQRLGLAVLMDVPRALRPGDERQRIGRIVRQGNMFPEVQVARFVSRGTTDEWLYSVMHHKAENIEAFWRGEIDTFDEVDTSAAEQDFEVAQRIATKDPRAIRLLDLKDEQRKISARADAEDQQKIQAAEALVVARRTLTHATRDHRDLVEAMENHGGATIAADALQTTIAGKAYTGTEAITEAIVTMARALIAEGAGAAPQTVPLVSQGLSLMMRQRVSSAVVIQQRMADGTMRQVQAGASAADSPDDADTTSTVKTWIAGALDDEVTGDSKVVSWSTDTGWKIQPGTKILNYLNKLPIRLANAESRVRRLEQKVAGMEEAAGSQTSTLRKQLQTITGEINEVELAFVKETTDADTPPAADESSDSSEAGDAGGDVERSIGTYATPQKSKDGKIGVPVTPGETPTVDGAVVSPMELPELVELAHEIGASVLARPLEIGTQGSFKGGVIGPGRIRLAPQMFDAKHRQQLTAVLAHEIGHLVDYVSNLGFTSKRGNLLGRIASLQKFMKHTLSTKRGAVRLKTVKAELQALSRQWRPWDPKESTKAQRDYRNSAKELYADALSALLTNPALVQTQAPTFWTEFFAHLDQKSDVQDAYWGVQELLAGDRGKLLAHRQALLEAGFGKAKQKSAALQAAREQALRDAYWNPIAFMNYIVDNTYALEHKLKPLHLDPEQDPLLQIKSLNHINLRPFTRDVVEPIVTELRDAEIPLETFGSVLFWRRITAGDRSELFNPGGITPEAAQEHLDATLAAFSKPQRVSLETALNTLYTSLKRIQDEAHAAGLYDEQTAAMMRESENYVPFQVVDYIDKAMTHRVQAQHGTAREIANPFVSAIIKVLVTKREIGINTAKLRAIRAVQQHFPGEVTDAPVKVWALKDGTIRREVKTPRDPSKGVVWVYDEGQAKAYVLDQYIAQSINRHTEGHNLAAVRFLNALNSKWFRRLHITHNPAFFLFNTLRDMPRMWRNNPRMGLTTVPRDLVDMMRAIPAALYRATDSALVRRLFPTGAGRIEAAERAGILGPLMRSDYLLGRAPDHDQIDDLVTRMLKRGHVDTPGKVLTLKRGLLSIFSAVEKTGNFFEAWAKATGIVNAERAYGSVEKIPPEERQRIRSDYGTHDFAAGGVYGAAVQSVFLYSNAMIQGTRADFQASKHPTTRAGWWWKLAAYTLSRKALQAAAYSGAFGSALVALGLRDEDDEDWMKQVLRRMSEYDRMFFDLIPLGVDGSGRGWALRLPTDYSGRLIGAPFTRAMEALLDEKDDDAVTLVQEMVQDFVKDLPNASPAIDMTIDTFAMVIGENPWDNFRQRNLFTQDEMLAGGWHKWQKYGRYMVQQSGVSAFIPIDLNGTRRKAEGAEAIFDWPVIGPTIGRLLRRSDFGLTQEAQAAQTPVAKGEAALRLSARALIRDAVDQYRDLAPAQQTPATRAQITRSTAQAAAEARGFADFREWRTYYRQIERQTALSLNFEDAAPLTSTIAQARTTDQAVAAATAMLNSGVTRPALNRWLSASRASGILSDARLRAIITALDSGG